MDVVILGANEQALELALSFLSKVNSITFFDRDLDLLENLQDEFENDSNDKLGIKFCSDLDFDQNHPLFIFDFLPDSEEKFNVLKQLRFGLLNGSLFFTTSKIYSVSKIASFLQDPKCVVGLQYLSPFENSQVIELVKGIHTSARSLERAKRIMADMGKEIMVVKDSPGFLLNRMTIVLINEAIHLLNEGLATPNEIDTEMELALGLKLGPLRLADHIGLDIVLSMLNSLYKGTGNPKFLPCSLLQNMVYSGYLGQKTNSGFYSYSAEILNFPHLKVY
ncbi:3-hydroxyacyl-CoA dehydrogenase family protein [Neobacillus cucumis]|nr:3-hydroxyacyl-CoA dehydrogenase family protein [Neobacillus cucumis]